MADPVVNKRSTDVISIVCKSFCGVYILAVRGQGEDAGTVARRLLEVTWQAIDLEVH